MKNLPGFFRQLQQNLKRNLQAMSSKPSDGTSMAEGSRPSVLNDDSLKQPTGISALSKEGTTRLCTVEAVEIPVSSSEAVKNVPGFLHIPSNYPRERHQGSPETGAILLSGASGGVVGPSSIYLSIADKLASLNRGIPVLRLDYRYPARNRYCAADVLAAMNYLQSGYSLSRFVLVGWSYGGAPVFTVGGREERVVGCATVASQTAETEGIVELARKNIPVLLMHGTGDQRLSPHCSESLLGRYKRHNPEGDAELKLFDGDDHSLTKNSLKAEELLCTFIMKQAGRDLSNNEMDNLIQKPLRGEQEKVEKMVPGGDLKGESIK